MAGSPSHALHDGSEPALTVSTVRLADAVLRIVCALAAIAPDTVMGKRPRERALSVRRLYFYALTSWLSAPMVERITGYNASHVNREVGYLWRWAETNAVIEELLEQLDSFLAPLPDLFGRMEELVDELVLEAAAARVKRAADRHALAAASPLTGRGAVPKKAPARKSDPSSGVVVPFEAR